MTRAGIRDLIDPIASRRVGHPLRTGAIVLVVAIGAVVLVFLNLVPILDSQGGYTASAVFAEANSVNDLTPVRVGGVDVGEVEGLSPGPDPRRSSLLRMRITNPAIVLHADATASIRWRTVLGGNMYVDLDPGSADAPKLSGPIPISQTSDQVELDDVLRIYNGSTAEAQRQMLAGLADGLVDPSGTDASIGQLPDLTTVDRGLAPYQGIDPGDLTGLVGTTARTVEQLGANTSALTNLVNGAAQTLSAVDDQRVALGETLALAPGTLQSIETTAHRLDVTLRALDPLASNLQPGARLIVSTSEATRPALAALRTVLDGARPVLVSARPTFANLRVAASTALPLLRDLVAPLSRLNTNILPWLAERSTDTKLLNFEAIGPFFSILDNAASEYDESGYRLHLSTLLGSASVLDESSLTSGEDALRSECARAASPAQERDCGAVTNVLAGMLLGGQR